MTAAPPLAPSYDVAPASAAVVPAFLCSVIFGGDWTAPASAEIIVAQRWDAQTRGLVQSFLTAQTSTLTVNDGSPTDVSDAWGPITASTSEGSYRAESFVSTGITLAAGDQMTFDLTLAMSHRIHDGFTLFSSDNHKPLFFGPGLTFDWPCTVTAQ